MNEREFSLKGEEYIELMKLLKYEGLAESGADAKMLIDAGEVRVNGKPEHRRRRKLRPGDKIQFAGEEISMTD